MILPDPVDSRPLSEVEFAWNVSDPQERAEKATRVREILGKCGASTAQDAIDLGCTGLAKHGVSIEDSRFVRDHMAGARFSLTCFVPPTLHCLVHETSGGLQVKNLANEAQEQRFAEMVPQISRELLSTESAHIQLIEHAMRMETREKEAKEMLRGHKLPEGWESSEGDASGLPRLQESPRTYEGAEKFESDPGKFACPEHGETFWNCRFCVAAEIIRGDLVPTLVIGHQTDGGMSPDDFNTIDGKDVPGKIGSYNNQGTDRVVLLARVAVWTRKLSR